MSLYFESPTTTACKASVRTRGGQGRAEEPELACRLDMNTDLADAGVHPKKKKTPSFTSTTYTFFGREILSKSQRPCQLQPCGKEPVQNNNGRLHEQVYRVSDLSHLSS